jgi:hypothetical protein
MAALHLRHHWYFATGIPFFDCSIPRELKLEVTMMVANRLMDLAQDALP